MAASVDEVSSQFVKAVETALNPSSLQNQRVEAYEFIEQFKSSSPLCIPVGLALFSRHYSPIVRHTALQLLEHTVKFKWNSSSPEDQEQLKEISLQMLAEGSGYRPDEPHHIKEALSRLIVEIAKREWPQKWTSLLQDLNRICAFGDVQTEVVLMVLLRLAEDAISMDSNLQPNRKRQITHGLHSNMEGLFAFFIKTLQKNTWKFKDLAQKGQCGDVKCQAQAAVHQRLAEQTLVTLTGFLDWVKFEVLFSQNCVILQILCLLLEEDSLKIPTCECLLIIVKRKGKLEQRVPLLKLFSEDAMHVMLSAAQNSVTSEFDERQYLFLKRLCQVLVALGEVQLFTLWNAERPNGKPPNFRQYLEAVLAFSKHESLILPLLTTGLWLTFLRNPVIKEDETFQAMLPSLLETSQAKLFKVGDPEKGDSPGSIFNREDFNSARAFTSVFAQVRGESMDIVRKITLLQPCETFLRGAEWVLQKTAQTSADGDTSVHEMDAFKQEWDGLTCFLEAIMSRFFKVDNFQEVIQKQVTFQGTSIGIIELARKCIEALLTADSKNTDVLVSIADATQALYPFLTYNQDLIMQVLKKMFAMALFNTTGDPKGPWTLDVLHARRRACAAVFKICKGFGHLLVPVFAALKEHVQSLFVGQLVSVKDRCTLTEALILASNQLKDGVKQTEFLVELLTPVRAIWLSDNLQRAVSSPEGLAAFTGLDKDPTTHGQDEKMIEGRFQIMLCITTYLGILRSCALKYSTQNAASEGLSIGLMPNGTPYVHNPCATLMLPLLGNVLRLAKSVNGLFSPSVKSAMCPGYASVLEMHELDKSAIYALLEPQEREKSDAHTHQNPLRSARCFLYQLTDYCYHTLGYACNCLGHDFYSLPDVPQLINESVINTLQYVPNYRLRFVVRNFMKMFILHCPPCDYETVLIPVLSPFLSFMLQHLEEEWLKVRQHQAESKAAVDEEHEEDVESNEVIEDQMVFIITRDYLEIFALACTVGSKELDASGGGMEVTEDEELKEEGENTTAAKKDGPDQFNVKLGSLGLLLLKSESINMQLLCTIFCCLTWPDSTASHKATRLAMPFIREMVVICKEAGTRIADTLFEQLFSQVLKGLQVHGQCSTQTYLTYVGEAMYELLRPQYPSLQQVLLQMTNCSSEDLKAFEATFMEGTEFSEKRKKELFKKLVTGIIGKHIGELFKNEIHIKDLPPIQITAKEKPPADLTGLAELFDPTRNAEEAY